MVSLYPWYGFINRGPELLHVSMISYRSVKTMSNYPVSCLEVRRKQKVHVNKPIFKGCPQKNICKYHHSPLAHVCRKKIVFQIIMLLLSDMLFIKHEACTKVSLHCTMSLFPITKRVELLLLSLYHVCNIMCIKTIGITRNCKASLCVSCRYSRNIRVKKRFIGGEHDKTSLLATRYKMFGVNAHSGLGGRCDNGIVTVLSNEQFTILKMASLFWQT